MKHLLSHQADALDRALFTTCKFEVAQLMELAGYAVAVAAHRMLSASDESILILIGPGNNGGDGLVAARHLALFGFTNITLCIPREPKRDLYRALQHQASQFGVLTIDTPPSDAMHFKLCIDAVFGFNFSGAGVRPPYAALVDLLATRACFDKLLSVDVPSGWTVDVPAGGQTSRVAPDAVISLTAPKMCMMGFEGRHFVGGRFIPPAIRAEYGVDVQYSGVDVIVEV